MFKTLQGRFILSHILPVIITIPIMGIAIIYIIETQFLVPGMSLELKNNILLISRIIGQNEFFWQTPDEAGELLQQNPPLNRGQLMVLDIEGTIIASSNREDDDRIGSKLIHPNFTNLPINQVVVTPRFQNNTNQVVADAIAPVYDSQNELIGYVRLSYGYTTFIEELFQLRFLLIGVLVVTLILGGGIGIVLAFNVSAPVKRVTKAMLALANGEQNEPLPIKGATEIRQLSEAINFLLERLRGMEKSRKRLLANLVHEIGRPLGALRMGIEALSSGAEKDPQFYSELVAGMDQETAHLQLLLEELSHLHDQVLGVLELDYEEIDLYLWLPLKLVPWREAAEKKHIHWELKIPKYIKPIQADNLRLGQIIGNLVSNAIKYSHSGDSILIEVGEQDAWTWIKVKDTGPGISPEDQKNVFVPFMRGDHGRRFPQGMGLGLTIARDLVNAHNGKLTLESKLGEGACFTVWLRQIK